VHATTPEVRGRVLDAARRVIVRDGSERLTIAAVAAEAGLSVGGLRYHYASKRDLLEALVLSLIEGFELALADAPTHPGGRTGAYIAATLDSDAVETGAAVGVLAAASLDAGLLAMLRERFRAWQALLDDDGLDPAVATTVRLAIDGWWFAAMLDLAPPQPPRSGEIRAILESMARGEHRAGA
jgi:AcrR family transcriptional regulator